VAGHTHLNRARLFDIQDEFNRIDVVGAEVAHQRDGASSIDVEVRLEFPVASVGEEFGPVLPKIEPGIARNFTLRILARHGGIPQSFSLRVRVLRRDRIDLRQLI